MIERPVTKAQRKHALTEGAGGTSTASCELRVEGMDCASCAATIERALENLEGVRDVSVDVVGGRVRAIFLKEPSPAGSWPMPSGAQASG